ncbi:hypothetical protein LF1_02120 [Rubripirellula obstinata]|uniref:Uncharacterized protein n=1 Tax=Rubripirellula obstinata TaxID=406547 RepID=A0A5B1CE37_9BACT|nr:hypothetical protein [Rubripirellula obstinata]KAA1257723.1 hypothetical protein LF1_02120 [Rubripirellula obstinata]
MQQIKIFKGVDTEIPEMERQINRWMRKSGAEIISIQSSLAPQPNKGTGPMNSFAGSDIMVVLHYQIDAPS